MVNLSGDPAVNLRACCRSNGTRPKSNRITSRYILVLGLLSCLTMAIQLLLVETLVVQRRETSIVELTAREQTFSQQSAKTALAIKATAGTPECAAYVGELREVLVEWAENHERLVEALRAESGDQGQLTELAEQYELSYQAILARAQAIGPTVSTSENAFEILRLQPTFLARINRLGQYHAEVAQDQKEQFRATGLAIVGMTLVLLLVQTGVYLLHVRKLNQQPANVQPANQELANQPPPTVAWSAASSCDEAGILDELNACHDAIRDNLSTPLSSDVRQLELFGELLASIESPNRA
jgi:hypothetical protein